MLVESKNGELAYYFDHEKDEGNHFTQGNFRAQLLCTVYALFDNTLTFRRIFQIFPQKIKNISNEDNK